MYGKAQQNRHVDSVYLWWVKSQSACRHIVCKELWRMLSGQQWDIAVLKIWLKQAEDCNILAWACAHLDFAEKREALHCSINILGRVCSLEPCTRAALEVLEQAFLQVTSWLHDKVLEDLLSAPLQLQKEIQQENWRKRQDLIF